MAKLILASASPRREDLLKQLNIKPDHIIAANIDEQPYKDEKIRPYTQRIAKEKCCAVRHLHANDFVLSADTSVSVGTRILGKAKNEQEARHYLQLLSGRSHRVYTALCLYSPVTDKTHQRIVESRVTFHRLDVNDINYYIALKEWQGKAGAYAIQGYGARFVRKIVGSYTNIVGLPCDTCYNLLKGSGYKPLQGKLDG